MKNEKNNNPLFDPVFGKYRDKIGLNEFLINVLLSIVKQGYVEAIRYLVH